MPLERERQTCARKHHNAATLLEIVDEINEARHLVDVAEMATIGLAEMRERNALAGVLSLVSDRLTDIVAALQHETAPDAA